MEADLLYYRRRWAEEGAAAAASSEPNVRRVHRELADQYQMRIAAIEANSLRAEIHLVTAA